MEDRRPCPDKYTDNQFFYQLSVLNNKVKQLRNIFVTAYCHMRKLFSAHQHLGFHLLKIIMARKGCLSHLTLSLITEIKNIEGAEIVPDSSIHGTGEGCFLTISKKITVLARLLVIL